MISMKPIARLMSLAVAAYCLLPAATVAAGGAAADCPDLDRVDRTWVEHSGKPVPVELLGTHLATPLMSAAPLLLPVNETYYWLGISVRNPYATTKVPNLSCYLLGSVAYYYNGVEQDPELDIVREINEGREPQLLVNRLIEFRWFDPKENKKHRWFNVALARRLDWLTSGDGTMDENLRPIPLPRAPNSLDIAQAADGRRYLPVFSPNPKRAAPARALQSARDSTRWLLK